MQDPSQITFFAKTDARGQQVKFGIKASDRTRHVYVIGKTGMGKSTLLENMAVQDMQHGNGLAFIDPHGATAETLLHYVPKDRVDDVLYFAPFDTDNPISFNVMEDVGADKRHLVVSGLMSVFKKIWVDAWSARMEYILSNTLSALLEYPDATLLGVNRMLSDKHYRKAVINNITDPAVKSFWVDEFLNYNERYMQEAGDAIKNKIGQFTSNPIIRNIVGQPKSSFDIRDVMDGRKILIANLSKGLVGESNANLLGSMLTTRIYLAAMSRADLSSEQMKAAPNFYFYVDEFQSFANATFADILSEARKYKLNLTIAHQYIEQMEEEVRNAVFGNVGTIIAFRVGPFDAEILETIFTPKFLAADIVNLGFAQIYLTLMIDGIGSSPFSAVTLPPIEPESVSYKNMVIAHSKQRYGAVRAPVETKINAWHEQSYDEKKNAYEAEKARKIAAGELPAQRPGANSNQVSNQNNKSTHTNRPQTNNNKNQSSPTRTNQQQSSKTTSPSRSDQKSERNNKNTDQRTPATSRALKENTNSSAKPPAKSANLDELRNVLKNIVGTDGKSTARTDSSSAPKKDSAQSKPEQKKVGADDKKNALKAAVAQAIGGEADSGKNDTAKSAAKQLGAAPPKPQHNSPAPSAQPKEAQTKQTDEPSKPDKPSLTPRQSTVATQVPPAPTAPKHTNDPIAPETLSRMMQVNNNERNPLQ